MELTQLIHSVSNGEQGAANSLLEVVYEELHRLAASQLGHEPSGHTLQTTALVHEAFLRLFAGQQPTWENRRHFFGAAAEAMRRILVDHARRKTALKRGGAHRRLGSVESAIDHTTPPDELLGIHDLLDRLAAEHPQKAEVVKLRYFAGLTIAQTAETLGLSVPTANRYWRFARAWMYQRLHPDSCEEGDTN